MWQWILFLPQGRREDKTLQFIVASWYSAIWPCGERTGLLVLKQALGSKPRLEAGDPARYVPN